MPGGAGAGGRHGGLHPAAGNSRPQPRHPDRLLRRPRPDRPEPGRSVARPAEVRRRASGHLDPVLLAEPGAAGTTGRTPDRHPRLLLQRTGPGHDGRRAGRGGQRGGDRGDLSHRFGRGVGAGGGSAGGAVYGLHGGVGQAVGPWRLGRARTTAPGRRVPAPGRRLPIAVLPAAAEAGAQLRRATAPLPEQGVRAGVRRSTARRPVRAGPVDRGRRRHRDVQPATSRSTGR